MDDLDNQLDDLENDDDGGTLEGDQQSSSGDSQSSSSSDDSSTQNSDKRISDLMSKWQKSEAKVRQLEAAMKQTGGTGAKPDVPVDAKLKAWIDAAASDVVERAYNSDPRFKQYGIEVSELKGDSPSEISEKVKSVRSLIDKMESRIRNEVLAEHGLVPDVSSSRLAPPKPFGEMTSKEFNEYMKSQGY